MQYLNFIFAFNYLFSVEENDFLLQQKINKVINTHIHKGLLCTAYFILCFTIFQACSKSTPNTEPPPNPPVVDPPVITPIEKGTIFGTATLYKFGNRIPPGGIKVTLINSKDSFSLTMNDNSERFIFDSIPYGTYDVRYEKSDMGTFYQFNLRHNKTTEPTIINHANLGLKSNFSLSYFSVAPNGNSIRFKQVSEPYPTLNSSELVVRYFFSKTRDISPAIYDTTYSIVYGSTANSADTFTHIWDYSFFNKLGFPRGSKMYVKAYGESLYNNAYLIPGKKYRTFPNINPVTTAPDSCIIP